MTDHDRRLVRARLAYWPGDRFACAWPTDPEEAERFWLLGPDGRVVATFWRYEAGRGVPAPRGT